MSKERAQDILLLVQLLASRAEDLVHKKLMNASKSFTDPLKCVKAARLEQAECRGLLNVTKGSVNAIRVPVNAIRVPVSAIRGPVNAIRGGGNVTGELVNARQRSDECRLRRSKQLSPTTAAAPHNKPGVHKKPIF